MPRKQDEKEGCTITQEDTLFESRAVYLCRTGTLQLTSEKIMFINRDGVITKEFSISEIRDMKKRGHTCISFNYANNPFESSIAILDFQRDTWINNILNAQQGRFDEILSA